MALPHASILVVDDGSTDGTGECARQSGVLIARLPYNLGVGGAMRLGYRYAVAHDFDVVVQIDADGQHDPVFVHAMLVRIAAGADLVIGARFAGVGSYEVRGPRRWAMTILSWSLSQLADTRLTDTTSGMRATSRDLSVFFARNYPVEYLGDTIETLAMAIRAGFRVEQEPVAMRPRICGRPSHARFKSTIYMIRAVVVLLLSLIRS